MSVMASETLVPSSPDAASIAAVNAVGLDGSDLALALLEQSEDCVKILSVDGHLEFMNCVGLNTMEIDGPEVVVGRLWWELWPEPSQAFIRERFKAALRGKAVAFEASCPTFKGRPCRWSVNLKPMCAAAGPVVSVLVTSREID